jgi:hypothetical protein
MEVEAVNLLNSNMNKWITWPTGTGGAFCDIGYAHKIFEIKS